MDPGATGGRGMRWRILILGLVAALVAGFALLQGFQVGPRKTPGATNAAGAGPLEQHDEIDDDSREQLREILRSAGDEDETNR